MLTASGSVKSGIPGTVRHPAMIAGRPLPQREHPGTRWACGAARTGTVYVRRMPGVPGVTCCPAAPDRARSRQASYRGGGGAFSYLPLPFLSTLATVGESRFPQPFHDRGGFYTHFRGKTLRDHEVPGRDVTPGCHIRLRRSIIPHSSRHSEPIALSRVVTPCFRGFCPR